MRLDIPIQFLFFASNEIFFGCKFPTSKHEALGILDTQTIWSNYLKSISPVLVDKKMKRNFGEFESQPDCFFTNSYKRCITMLDLDKNTPIH
jgi:hypothetical protein